MDAKDLVGTWKLVDYRLTDSQGNMTRPREGRLQGRLIYSAEGYVGVASVSRDDSYFSYFGRYELNGSTMTHHAEISSDPKVAGTAQKRSVAMEDGLVVLTASPSNSGGPGTSAALVWERIQA